MEAQRVLPHLAPLAVSTSKDVCHLALLSWLSRRFLTQQLLRICSILHVTHPPLDDQTRHTLLSSFGTLVSSGSSSILVLLLSSDSSSLMELTLMGDSHSLAGILGTPLGLAYRWRDEVNMLQMRDRIGQWSRTPKELLMPFPMHVTQE